MKKFLLLTIPVLLIAAACNKQAAISPSPTPTPTPAPTPQVYENSNLKLTLADGWTAKQANKIVYVGDCANFKSICTSTPTTEPNPAAVNITNGNYILYINTQASQASGVEGGRFAEIAMGAPSADAVVTVQPSEPCGTKEKNPTFDIYTRVDLFVNNQVNVSYCKVPSNGTTVWYFSYFTDNKSGYFIHDWNSDPSNLVITMSYNSKIVNEMPVKGSTELNAALSDMTSIVKSLEIKQK